MASAVEALKPCPLSECPPGPFLFNGCLGFKTEYGMAHGKDICQGRVEWSVTNRPDAYVMASGEVFAGGAPTPAERDALIVQPVDPDELLAALNNTQGSGEGELRQLADDAQFALKALCAKYGYEPDDCTPLDYSEWREARRVHEALGQLLDAHIEAQGSEPREANDDLGPTAPWCAFINPEGYASAGPLDDAVNFIAAALSYYDGHPVAADILEAWTRIQDAVALPSSPWRPEVDDEVLRQVVRAKCDEAGSVAKWAASVGMVDEQVNLFLRGKRPAEPKLLAVLGLERRVTYLPAPPSAWRLPVCRVAWSEVTGGNPYPRSRRRGRPDQKTAEPQIKGQDHDA